MAHINLLPWRQAERERRQREFGIVTAMALAFTGLIFFGVYTYVNDLISYQTQRNELLKQAIKEADKKIKEIERLEAAEENLERRISAINALEESRSEIVHLFDELAKSRPENVYYESLEQENKKVVLKGFAQSNTLVSTLARSLSRSPWIKNVRIDETIRREKGQRDLYEFTILYEQQTALEAVKSLTSEVKSILDNELQLRIDQRESIERLRDLPAPYNTITSVLMAMAERKKVPELDPDLKKKLDSNEGKEVINAITEAQNRLGKLVADKTGNNNSG